MALDLLNLLYFLEYICILHRKALWKIIVKAHPHDGHAEEQGRLQWHIGAGTDQMLI